MALFMLCMLIFIVISNLFLKQLFKDDEVDGNN